MTESPRKLELTDDEVNALLEILKYSLMMCPVESISQTTSITSDKVQDLIDKLEKAKSQ